MKKILIIVDVQEGFINEKTKHIPKLVETLQNNYEIVIATRFINAENSLYRKLIHWNKFGKDSSDIRLAFTPKKNAIIIDKYKYTCIDDDFLKFLSSKGIKSVDICGIDTDICVTKCAVDLFEQGIEPCVLKDYCATHASADIEESSLVILSRYIGSGQII